jgi:hypothetical protein
MSRYAIIEDGVVANIAVGDAEWAASVRAVPSDEAEIGWTYADGVFTPPPPPDPIEAPVPATIPLRQLVLGLLSYGKATDAQALAARTIPPGFQPVVDQMAADQQLVVALTIQTMTEADRADPLIDLAAAAYGWDATAADDFFRAAALL